MHLVYLAWQAELKLCLPSASVDGAKRSSIPQRINDSIEKRVDILRLCSTAAAVDCITGTQVGGTRGQRGAFLRLY